MKIKILRGLAVFLIIEVGLTHLFTTQHALDESWLEGFLFAANFLGALLSAYGIYRGKTWGWVLGSLVAAGAMLAYIWSRTTGLPGLPPEGWFYTWGVTAMTAEILFFLVVPLRVLLRKQSEQTPTESTNTRRILLTGVSLLALVVINASAFHLDALYPELDHGHVFFLWQVRLQPEISLKTLETQYGLQIPPTNVSVRDNIVAVGMRVLDSEKAKQLIADGHFALLVDGDTIIEAPHVSRHMLANKTIILLFPNQNYIIKRGTQVSLVFENLKVEPITAR